MFRLPFPVTRKTRIFISYSRADVAFADRLYTALTARGYEVHIDRSDLASREEWESELLVLIRKADTVIFIVSPRSIASAVCQWEIEQAKALRKRLAPVVLERVADDGVTADDGMSPPINKAKILFFDPPHNFETQASALSRVLKKDIGWWQEHTRLTDLAWRWDQDGRPKDQLLRLRAVDTMRLWERRVPKNTYVRGLLLEFILESLQGRFAWSSAAVPFAIVLLGAIALILHLLKIYPLLNAFFISLFCILWVTHVFIGVGSVTRRCVGTLLVLGLYAGSLLLIDQGTETVRAMNELSPGMRLLATVGWAVAISGLALVLVDSTRSLLRNAGGTTEHERALILRWVLAGPFLIAFFSLGQSVHQGGLFAEDGLVDLVTSGHASKVMLGLMTFSVWALIFLAAFIPPLELSVPKLPFLILLDRHEHAWFDRREWRWERRLDLSRWSIAVLLTFTFCLFVLLAAPRLAIPWNLPAPIFLAGWLVILVGGLAIARAVIHSYANAFHDDALGEKAIGAPVVVLLVVIAVILSWLDLADNHELAYRRYTSWMPAPLAEDAFREQLAVRFKGESRPTVFVVAAEGGGARAAYMTALTLEVLRRYCAPFAERHFATVGVSGGSVGAALSAASTSAGSRVCELPSEIDPAAIAPAVVAGTDVLSASLRGLLLIDLPMRFLPGSFGRTDGAGGVDRLANSPFSAFADRAQHIEWALDDAWHHSLGDSPLRLGEQAFRDFAPGRGGNRPALVLLATDIASGRRVAFSHLRFRPEPPSWKSSATDCRLPTDEAHASSDLRARLLTFEDIAPGRDTTLLAAAVASARFPVISPAATLPCPKPHWRVVDGGYFENTGLTTVLELLEHLVSGAAAADRRVRVILLRIENGEATTSESNTSDHSTAPDEPTASELWAPLQAYEATRDARADGARKSVDLAARAHLYGARCSALEGESRERTRNCIDFDQVVIKLQPCNIPVPLGWSLSAAARADIARQLGLIKSDPRDLALRNSAKCMDPIARKNREGLERLMHMATGRS